MSKVGRREARPAPATSCRVPQPPMGSAKQPGEAGKGLTYEAAAQPHLGDGAIVGVAAQVELLVQVQALELALGSGKVENGRQAGQSGERAGNRAMGQVSPGRSR